MQQIAELLCVYVCLCWGVCTAGTRETSLVSALHENSTWVAQRRRCLLVSQWKTQCERPSAPSVAEAAAAAAAIAAAAATATAAAREQYMQVPIRIILSLSLRYKDIYIYIYVYRMIIIKL